MFCPFCKNEESNVKDSRLSDDGSSIRRRRECPGCGARFTTYERVQFKDILIAKKNGEKEFFDQEKLRHSMKMAIRKRNISSEELDKVVSDIYQELCQSNESEISSTDIGNMVMKKLKKLDMVAFIRFASVYKNFENTDDFASFLKKNS